MGFIAREAPRIDVFNEIVVLLSTLYSNLSTHIVMGWELVQFDGSGGFENLYMHLHLGIGSVGKMVFHLDNFGSMV
jgi:hypothetical protein